MSGDSSMPLTGTPRAASGRAIRPVPTASSSAAPVPTAIGFTKPLFLIVLAALVLAQFDFSPGLMYSAVADRYGQAALSHRFSLHGMGIETGVDLDALVATSVWMAGHLGRPSPSRVVTALAGA